MALLIVIIIVLVYLSAWLINEGAGAWVLGAIVLLALFSYHQHEGQQACLSEVLSKSTRESISTGSTVQETKDCYKNNPYPWDIIKGHERGAI